MIRPTPFLLVLGFVVGASTLLAPAAVDAQARTPRDEPRTLRLANRDIVTFRSEHIGVSPAARVRRAQENVASLRPRELLEPLRVFDIVYDGVPGTSYTIGNRSLFLLLSDDVDPLGSRSYAEEKAIVEARLRDALSAMRRQRDPKVFVRGVWRSTLATCVFVLLITALRWLGRAAVRRFRRFAEAKAAGHDWAVGRIRSFFETWVPRLLVAFSFFFALLFTYLYLTFVFSQFPLTSPYADMLGHFLWTRATWIAQGLVAAIPNLVTVVVILAVARLVDSGLESLFSAVQRRQIELPFLHPDTVGATRRIALAVVWLFALVAAYPYFPGAGTDAFRGVSVFLGLLVSLGSTGVVGHLMSGLVLVYSRAMRRGDYVKIGEVEGWVLEVGALSVKLRTVANEVVTVPNATVVGTPIENHSSVAEKIGAAVTTKVTIGYDAPWRQVHALLELAASRTSNLKKDPKPFVLQTALSDFYVEYQLIAQLVDANAYPLTLSELNAAVQDAFNEFGVQIMSPHFVLQPREAVLVPKEKEHAAPAAPAAGKTETAR
ncbi:MAG: mechanosensitive ion channel [Polyangiales bacterium]